MSLTTPLRASFLGLTLAAAAWPQAPRITLLGTFRTGSFNTGAAEIAAHDPASQRLFVVNGGDRTIDVLDIAAPATPRRISQLRIPTEFGVAANSVAVRNGIVAAAVEADPKTDPGAVVFYDANGRVLGGVKVGALPDMLIFTPDGTKVLVANEGEPNADYTVDPEGSVSIVDVSGGVTALTAANVRTAHFRNIARESLDPSVRVFGPRATVAQDFEPEYITVSPDSKTAWATIQESNAIAIIDVDTATVTRVVGLGLKEHFREENSFDASARDNRIALRTWPVWGFYMPDSIASVAGPDGNLYLITAHEGDARDYAGFAEERRVSEVQLDPTRYPNAA